MRNLTDNELTEIKAVSPLRFKGYLRNYGHDIRYIRSKDKATFEFPIYPEHIVELNMLEEFGNLIKTVFKLEQMTIVMRGRNG